MSKKASADREQTLKENGMVIATAPKDVMAKIDEIGKEMIAEWIASAAPDEKAVYETYRNSLK
jgi:hypothetical protein